MEELCDKLRIKGKKDNSLITVLADGKEKLEAMKGDEGVKERWMDFVGLLENFLEEQEALAASEVALLACSCKHACIDVVFHIPLL